MPRKHARRSDSVTPEALAALREDMLRFATLQLRDATAAEDVVQEALAAAIANADGYAGRARLKTWVFAILRHKIVDVLREQLRQPAPTPYSGGAAEEPDSAFDAHGFWQKTEQPSDWGKPEADLENDEFWGVFEACLICLPESSARVFTMRELLGLGTAEICSELSISERNCWVILYRARMRLRLCLEAHWFEGAPPC